MATMDFKLTGIDKLINSLERKGKNAQREMERFVVKEAEKTMQVSKEMFVPVDTGNLRNSGFVEKPQRIGRAVSIALGFGGPAAPYAAAIHENPRAGETGGFSPSGVPYGPRKVTLPNGKRVTRTYATTGGWKYLKKALDLGAKTREARLKHHLEKALQR